MGKPQLQKYSEKKQRFCRLEALRLVDLVHRGLITRPRVQGDIVALLADSYGEVQGEKAVDLLFDMRKRLAYRDFIIMGLKKNLLCYYSNVEYYYRAFGLEFAPRKRDREESTLEAVARLME